MRPPRSQNSFLYEKLANSITELIQEGAYRPGDRIPSLRQMSKQQRVSISTVQQAYRILENRGILETHPQSGYYIRLSNYEQLPEPDLFPAGTDPCHVSLHELMMMITRDSHNPNLIQLGLVIPGPDKFPTVQLNRIISRLARQSGEEIHKCKIPPGLEALRVQIAQRSLSSGCYFSPNDIVITSGAIEAVNLCLGAVCKPGDIVAIESPMYFGILQSLEMHGLRALEIPTHQHDGISLDALRFAIEHNPIKAVLVLSNFNNPLGSCIPDDRKKELVALLTSHDIPLIENDTFGEIYFSGRRPLTAKSFDTKGLVMLCSSFSKDIGSGLRVGWVVPGRYKAKVEWLKFTTNVATATLPQMAIAEFLTSGGYDRHLRNIRREYARNVNLLSQAVTRYFPSETRVTRPTGGAVLWVQLPKNIDSIELYKLALQNNIAIAPGYLFSATNRYAQFFRLNAVAWSYPIERAVERLGNIVEIMQSS